MIIYLADFDHNTQCCVCGKKIKKGIDISITPLGDYYKKMYFYFDINEYIPLFWYCRECWSYDYIFAQMEKIQQTTGWKIK